MYTLCNLLCNVVHPTWLNIFRTWSCVCECAFTVYITSRSLMCLVCIVRTQTSGCAFSRVRCRSKSISLFIFNISIGQSHTFRLKLRSFISSVLTFYSHVLKNWWHIFHPWFPTSGFTNHNLQRSTSINYHGAVCDPLYCPFYFFKFFKSPFFFQFVSIFFCLFAKSGTSFGNTTFRMLLIFSYYTCPSFTFHVTFHTYIFKKCSDLILSSSFAFFFVVLFILKKLFFLVQSYVLCLTLFYQTK